jgi:hypothetical protein
MTKMTFLAVLILSTSFGLVGQSAKSHVSIVCPQNASTNIYLAAKEVRRYIYLTTGELLSISSSLSSKSSIVLKTDKGMREQEYRLKTEGDMLTISGGSDVAVLYGVYAFAEKLGVRFYIHGDVIPDGKIAFKLPELDERHQPLFELRGLQPFHDFPEGPDWWTKDEWLSIVSQTAKMRMNFIGLHTYPFHNTTLGPEPTVWIGLPEDVNEDGTVKSANFTTWYNTQKLQPYGCYAPGKTSSFSFGGAEIFPTDDYGSEINTAEDFPFPKSPEANVALINRTGKFLKSIFEEASSLGIKTCVGTESPLDIPDNVTEKLKDKGLNPTDSSTLQKIYEGMFLRIQRAYPIDYYWIWGHEGEIDQKRYITNLLCANEALKSTKVPFGLGICGWGWITGNFPVLDRVLPKNIVFSAINMSVGNAPVSENFGQITNRQKWAIPWFEDDPALTSLQLHAGRIRFDAVDARKYGCNGFFGLHWRTTALSPNISALAQAGWEQGEWSKQVPDKIPERDVSVIGGKTEAYLNNVVSGAGNNPVYQTLRSGVKGYRFKVTNGTYNVTLHFQEPVYKEAGKRVFAVKLQGNEVIKELDIYKTAGEFTALTRSFENIVVQDGELRLAFVKIAGNPCISAIEVSGNGFSKKINCGGTAYLDYEADAATETLPRSLPVTDFYEDWAVAQFGREVGSEAAKIFTKLDGNYPTPSGWNRGPGVIVINPQPWNSVEPNYQYVAQMEGLFPLVKGNGNKSRFEWWLNTFKFNRSMAMLGCARGKLDAIISRIDKVSDADICRKMANEEALPVRKEMVKILGEMYLYLLATLNNSTELGTVANIELQSMLRVGILKGQDGKLEKFLGVPLQPELQPWQDYRGEPRLTVMNARGSLSAGESLSLKIIAMDKQPVKSVNVRFRPLGKGSWQTIETKHIARSVWNAPLPAFKEDIEYQVIAKTSTGAILVWPATAPEHNQTIIITK